MLIMMSNFAFTPVFAKENLHSKKGIKMAKLDHEILEVLFKAVCEAESEEQALRAAAAAKKPKEMSPREFMAYIERLSISKLAFKDKASEKAHAKQLESGYKRFEQLVWKKVNLKKYSKKKIKEFIKALDVYAKDSKYFEEASSPCNLSGAEKIQLISNLKGR